MTPGQKVRLLKQLERGLLRQMVRLRNRTILGAYKEALDSGYVDVDRLLVSYRSNVAVALEEHYAKAIRHFGRVTRRELSRAKQEVAGEEFYDLLIASYTAEHALFRASGIAGTLREDILTAMENALEAGATVQGVARAVRTVSGLTAARSVVIAITETHNAAMYASVETAREIETRQGERLFKQWAPTLDERTRPAHMAMEGTPPIPMNEKFTVGGEKMDRPGDPAASPENTIRCRCVLKYYYEDEL